MPSDETKVGRVYLTRGRKLALGVTVAAYLGAAATVYVFIDKETLRTALALPVLIVVALLALSALNYVVRAWRWVVLCEAMDIRVPRGTNVLYYVAGYALTSTPGKAGEAIRLWFLKSGHDAPYEKTLPLMVADRIIDVWAVLLLALLSIAGFAMYAWQGVVLALLIACVSAPILVPAPFECVPGMLHRLVPGRARWWVRGRRLLHAMRHLSSWRTYGLTLVPTIGGWVAECAALYLLLEHFGTEVSFVNATFIFSFSLIVGAISMLPGGLGSTEAAIVILLRTLGVDLAVALVVTTIIRTTTFWFAVAIGVLVMPAAMNRASQSGRARGSL